MADENEDVSRETSPTDTPETVSEPVEIEASADETGEPAEITEEAATSTEESEPQKPTGIQKRINELTRARYEAERKAQEAEDRLRELERQTTQQTYQSQKPRLEDFGYDQDAWATALENWAEQGIKQQQDALQQQREQEAQNARVRKIQQKISTEIAKMTQKYPDYLSKLDDPSVPNLGEINAAAQEALLESDHMGELAYYLASNPDKIYEFASMSPVQAVRAITKLENQLGSKSPPVTNAPPPITPMETTKGEATKDPDKMTVDEWMDWRYGQLS